MRALGAAGGEFDAALSLWQSFGYFDDLSNERVLAGIVTVLRPGGRFVLDIYNRSFFETRQGTRQFERNGVPIYETKQIHDNRLRVVLTYGSESDSRTDTFDWRVFTPDEIGELGSRHSLSLVLTCTSFEARRKPVADDARMQLVLEKQ